MAEKKIRMATSENPEDQGHTIVGGRPMAQKSSRKDIPRGLELLIKRASIDSDFRKDLLQKRVELLEELNINLDETEKGMLACVPEEHLARMIDATEVPAAQRKAISSGSVAAMIALFTQLAFAPVPGRAETTPALAQNAEQINNTENNEFAVLLTGIRPDDDYEDHLADRGARPDFPDDFEPSDVIQPSEPLSKATDSLLENPPEKLTVNTQTELQGQGFQQALEKLSAETGITINQTGLNEILAEYPLESETAGKSLAETLQMICNEAAGDGYTYRCNFDEEALTLNIDFKMTMDFEPKPIIKPSFDDSSICRGIRSDMPELIPVNPEDDEGNLK